MKLQKVEDTPLERMKILVFDSLLLNLRFISFFFHFVFTLCGIVFGRWFFTLNLFLITNLSQNLNYIIYSITKHFGKMIITLLMTVLLIFSFTFLFMKYFTESIRTGEFGDEVCNDYFNCFFNAMNSGMRFGGGISDFLHFKASPDEDKYWARFAFDIIYFIFIQMIFLNIVSGIIIDTFSELRDELTERNKDQKNNCHICGLTRFTIQKKKQSFENHKDFNHDMFAYIFFLVSLKGHSQQNYTQDEQYIAKKLKKGESNWIPIEDFLQENETRRNYASNVDEEAD